MNKTVKKYIVVGGAFFFLCILGGWFMISGSMKTSLQEAIGIFEKQKEQKSDSGLGVEYDENGRFIKPKKSDYILPPPDSDIPFPPPFEYYPPEKNTNSGDKK